MRKKGGKAGGGEVATTETLVAHKALTIYFIYSLVLYSKSLLTSALENWAGSNLDLHNYEESVTRHFLGKDLFQHNLLCPFSGIDHLSLVSPNHPANIE